MQSAVQYAILAISYLGLALGYLPGLRMNRATIALVGQEAASMSSKNAAISRSNSRILI